MLKILSLSFLILFSNQCYNVKDVGNIRWIYPETVKEINELIDLSAEKHILFYKHSYKCGLCHMILDDLEKAWNLPSKKVEMVFIEVNKQKELAKYLENISGYRHHSPQVLLFKDKEVVYQETHGRIKPDYLKSLIE